MKIYSSTETNFTRNGYGFLNDCIEAYVEETLNGEYTLYFEYPINAKLSEYLVEQNIVSANVSATNEQLFRIYRVEKDFELIKVYCNHISYDLLFNMLMDVYPQNKSVQEFGTWLLNNTQYAHSFSFYSDINKTGSARYVRKNPIECIIGNLSNSMLTLFGGELERDNFTIKLLAHRGQNNHVKLLIGKNITEIETNVDITNLYTRIIPVGFDGLVLPERFVDSPLINSYPSPRIAKIEFSNIKYDPESTEEGVYTDIQDAYQALRDAVNLLYQQGIDKPQISIKVDWLELSKTEQYKNAFSQFEKVNLGDTITASILGIDYTTQVVKTKYNVLSDTIESFEIGTIQKSIVNSINFTQNEIEKINPSSILEEAKQSASNLITNALSGYIYLDYEHGNLYIMDNPDPSLAQKVWRWNLNGLGYSSTGINGTFGIAITMDGSIVADYITTGHINTSVIQGYDELVAKVNNVYVFTDEQHGTGYVDITNGKKDGLLELSVKGNLSDLYPSNTLYPSDTLYPHSITLSFYNNEEYIYYGLNVGYLDTLGDVSDEYQIYSYYIEDDDTNILKSRIIRRIGYEGGVKVVLDNPVVTELGDTDINIPYGDTRVSIQNENDAILSVKYLINNEITETFATKAYVNSEISITEQAINIEVNKKVGKNEVISAINLSPEEITIESNKISLAGKQIDMTSDNISISSTNFNVDSDGNMTANSGTFGGTISTSEDCIVGNNLKIGVNQSPSSNDIKYLQLSNNTKIERNLSYGLEHLTLQSYYIALQAKDMNENWFDVLFEDESITSLKNGVGQYLNLDYGYIEVSSQPVTPSDERLKQEIKDIDVDWINELDIKEFEYKRTPNKKHIGLIAQNYIDKDYSKYFLNQNREGYYGIDYGSITNALIKYTQQLNKRIESLEQEVKDLKGGK